MAAKKKSSARPAASRSKKKPRARAAATKRKAAGPKTAGRKAAGRETAAKPSATKRRRVTTAVKATARRGLDVAKEGLGRIKSATTHLVEEVRERLAGAEDEARDSSR